MRLIGSSIVLVVWTVLVALATAVAAEVTLTTLDGRSLKGDLASWDSTQVVVSTAEGDQTHPIKELISLRWSAAAPEAATDDATPAAPQIELTDGTILPIEGFESSGNKLTATLTGALAAETKNLSLARRQVVAVRLQPLDPALVPQWDEIRAMKPTGDVLAVLKRDGKSLDYVEGVLGDIAADKVEFKLDDEPVQIDRSKIAGLIYFRRNVEGDVPADPICVVHGMAGVRLAAKQARLADNAIQLTTPAGAELTLPLDSVSWIDFSAGKLLYLSDLDPASESWTPLVALPASAELASAFGKSRRDQSAYGGPLLLPAAPAANGSPVNSPREFTKGLAVRSRTELLYRLPTGFRRFIAIVGIDPATAASGNVHLQIFGDDRPLLEADVAGGEPPQDIDLDIANVKRLKILVDYGQNQDTGDWLNLCDAKVVK